MRVVQSGVGQREGDGDGGQGVGEVCGGPGEAGAHGDGAGGLCCCAGEEVGVWCGGGVGEEEGGEEGEEEEGVHFGGCVGVLLGWGCLMVRLRVRRV